MTDGQVALYARVSSEHQAEANTIASQVAGIRERIAADDVDLRSVQKAASSAKSADRH
jgi:site-specific DNA recombinase